MQGSANPFQVRSAQMAGKPLQDAAPGRPAVERIERMISGAPVLLLMKGTPEQPMCGFSANTVAILEGHGVPYTTFDVLSDDDVRSAAKEYARWPTFPQLWIRGELVGGSDIVSEMHASGELHRILEVGGRG